MRRGYFRSSNRQLRSKPLVAAGAAACLAATLGAHPPDKRGSAPEPGLTRLEAVALVAAMDKELAVRTAYDKYADYVRGAGDEISIELFNFRSLTADELDQVYWASLFTFPAGRVLEAEITQLGEEAVHVDSRWVDRGSGEELLKMTREVANMKASAVAGMLREHDANFYNRLAGATTYDVIVEFEGESRAYTASFLWLPVTETAVDYVVLDHVIPRLKGVVGENLPAITREELERRLTRPSDPIGGTFLAKATCVDGAPQTVELDPLSIPILREGHVSGGHWNEYQPTRTCDTDSACRSICTPGFAWTNCIEHGFIKPAGWLHLKYQRFFAKGDEAIGTSSTCHNGVGCAVESCLLGACEGVSFTGSGKGPSFTISVSGAPMADMSLERGMVCPAAVTADGGGETEEPDQRDTGDGGSGGTGEGGGGGGGGDCSWNCRSVWDPVNRRYSEECDLIC